MDRLEESIIVFRKKLKEKDLSIEEWNEFAKENNLLSAITIEANVDAKNFEHLKKMMGRRIREDKRIDTYPYFNIRYTKNKKHKTQLTETDAILPAMIEIIRDGGEIVEIVDNLNQSHSEEEIIEMQKETIDIEYEDVKSIKEAYELTFDYFRELVGKNIMYEKDYLEHIEKLKKIRDEEKELDQFIEKAKELYFV